MRYNNIPPQSILGEIFQETSAILTPTNELETEFESWLEKLRSFWKQNKSQAQKLLAAGQIVGRLISPMTPVVPNQQPTPPITQKTYADYQRTKQRRRREQAATILQPKDRGIVGKELENTLLGEILRETSFQETTHEIAILTGELNAIYDQFKAVHGSHSLQAEMLLMELEEELRKDVRKNHFKSGNNPTGVEVHHWFPLKYAALLPENIKSKINNYTVALDRVSHAYIGKAIDLYLKKDKDYNALTKILGVMGNIKEDGILLNPTLFVRKNRDHQATSDIPMVNNSLSPDDKFYGLRSISYFRKLMGKMGVDTKQLELQFLP